MERKISDFPAYNGPLKDDKLFQPGEDWWHNACLNYMDEDGKWVLYVHGYKLAADLLVENVDQTQSKQDFLVFPIVFLYRQYLELSMKNLIRLGQLLQDRQPEFPKTHSLSELWEHCKSNLNILHKHVWVPTDEIEAITILIEQFSTSDPSSQAFRYPIDRQGNNSLPDSLTHINLRNLSEVMNKIDSFLDGAIESLTVIVDTKMEMLAHYSSVGK